MSDFICGKYKLSLGKKTYIMGILNVTPDSFSDGGKFFDEKNAVKHAEEMALQGADILDIGSVSTRPFSQYVSPEEEWDRLKNVLKEIRKNFDIPISVDTFNASTALHCLDTGADIINDVSGVFNDNLATLIKKYNAGWIIMHGGVGVQKTETEIKFNDSIVKDVNKFFNSMINQALDFGVNKNNICLDAGFGFAKTNEQNIELLQNYEKLNKQGLPLLCALSRKRFIGEISNDDNSEDRLGGTIAANITGIIKGADIIRVHEVAVHKKSIDAIDRLYR